MPETKTCYGCRYLLQGGDGENACAKFGEPGYPETPVSLAERPEPLYYDCYEEFSRS
jgi:hypothetical protein